MTWRPESAMVLAAGLGTRMRSFNGAVPKPLVPLAGRPLIDHALDRLGEAGIAHAIVNVHYKAELIITHLAARQQRPVIRISDERGELLDTGGGVRKALPQLGSGPFLIHNSDSVWIEREPNLGRLAGVWDADRMDCLLLLADRANSIGYTGRGDFGIDAVGRLRRPGPGEAVPYAFAGVSVATQSIFAASPAGAFSLNLPWDRAIAEGRAFGIVLEGIWLHVGDPEALTAAERLMQRDGASAR